MSAESDLMTKRKAAEKLRVSPSTVDRLRAQGEIAWVAVGRQARFRPEAIAAYTRAQRAARAPRGDREAPAPRARAHPGPPPGSRRRLPQAPADFDELLPLAFPAGIGGEAR